MQAFKMALHRRPYVVTGTTYVGGDLPRVNSRFRDPIRGSAVRRILITRSIRLKRARAPDQLLMDRYFALIAAQLYIQLKDHRCQISYINGLTAAIPPSRSPRVVAIRYDLSVYARASHTMFNHERIVASLREIEIYV